MSKFFRSLYFLFLVSVFSANPGCQPVAENKAQQQENIQLLKASNAYPVQPYIVTEPVMHDSDDPAIWVNHSDAAKSLILGTDKQADGALYVFDLEGNIVEDKVVRGLQRPNNVDVAYGLLLNGVAVDVALVTERMTHKLRMFSLPDMQEIDGGGLPMFEGETQKHFRDLMGVAAYKAPDGTQYAIVGRKNGPSDGTYLWQYRLYDNGNGQVAAELVRKFGKYSGLKEIEAIAVDHELGYVYYSDETFGVRKYHAEPGMGNEELAVFATQGFTGDHEGISIYQAQGGKGYILVSDQQANCFQIFTREGFAGDPHDHRLLKVVHTATLESDGSEVTSLPLNSHFPKGMFIAMSTDKTFHFYRWEDIAGEGLGVDSATE